MQWHCIITQKYSPKYTMIEHYKFKNIAFLMGHWAKTNVWHRRRISPRAIVTGCLWHSKYKGICDMAWCPCAAFSPHICETILRAWYLYPHFHRISWVLRCLTFQVWMWLLKHTWSWMFYAAEVKVRTCVMYSFYHFEAAHDSRWEISIAVSGFVNKTRYTFSSKCSRVFLWDYKFYY